MIDSTFKNNKKLFVVWIKAGINDLRRNFFDKSYILTIDIEDCNVSIDNKTFVGQPTKTNKKHLKNK